MTGPDKILRVASELSLRNSSANTAGMSTGIIIVVLRA